MHHKGIEAMCMFNTPLLRTITTGARCDADVLLGLVHTHVAVLDRVASAGITNNRKEF